MAKYLDLTGLTEYDTKIKQYISSAIASGDEVGFITISGSAETGTLSASDLLEAQKHCAIIYLSNTHEVLYKYKYNSTNLYFKNFAVDLTDTIDLSDIEIEVTISGGSWVKSSQTRTAVSSGELSTALATKQDTLTFDNAPTQNSNNPVKSGGLYSEFLKYLKNYANGSSDWDTTPTANSNKPVTSGGIKTALDGKQDSMTAISNAEVDALFS